MSFTKKAALCASMFAMTAFGAVGQNTSPVSSPKERQNRFTQNAEFMILMKSFHTDRITPFNEWNPGIFMNQKINGNLSAMQGAYYNSNYTLAPTSGVMYEVPVGRAKFGLLAGIAIYPRVQKDVRRYTVERGLAPPNEKRNGVHDTYIQMDDGRYFHIHKEYKARGLRGKFRVIPALLATFSYNAYRGSGPFATFTYVPWKSGEHKGLGIAAFGARINPRPELR